MSVGYDWCCFEQSKLKLWTVHRENHLILFLLSDPTVAEVDGGTYWRNPFNSLVSPRQLEEFIVMDTDIIRNQKLGAGAGIRSNKVGVLREMASDLELGCPVATARWDRNIPASQTLPYPRCGWAICVPPHGAPGRGGLRHSRDSNQVLY